MRITVLFMILVMIFSAGCEKLKIKDPEVEKYESQIKLLEYKLEKLYREKDMLIEDLDFEKAKNEILTEDYRKLQNIAVFLKADLDDLRQPVETDPRKFVIEFDPGQDYSLAATAKVAKAVNSIAKAHDYEVDIIVVGYATKAGTKEENMLLSMSRAQGVIYKILEFAEADARLLNIGVVAFGENVEDARKVVVHVELRR